MSPHISDRDALRPVVAADESTAPEEASRALPNTATKQTQQFNQFFTLVESVVQSGDCVTAFQPLNNLKIFVKPVWFWLRLLKAVSSHTIYFHTELNNLG